MPTETQTYYVVRNDDGWFLYSTFALLNVEEATDFEDIEYGPEQFGWSKSDEFCNRYTRAEAEAKAAEHGGKVRRVTVTTEDVGLRWDDSQRGRLYLRDSEATAGLALAVVRVPWDDGDAASHVYEWRGNGERQIADSLEEAKAAAEAAVRETWT